MRVKTFDIVLQWADPSHVKDSFNIINTIISGVGRESESLPARHSGCGARWFKPIPVQ
jgi:hypothetical protein